MAERLGDAEVDAALHEVLGAAPFSRDNLDDLWRILRDWYHHRVVDMYITNPALFWGALFGLTVVLVLLVWHMSYTLSTAWQALSRRRVVAAGVEMPVAPPDLGPADAALASGDFRAAIELAFAAAAQGLRREIEATLPPRQLWRALAARVSDDAQRAFKELLSLHEAACYGGSAPDRRAAERAVLTARQLLGMA